MLVDELDPKYDDYDVRLKRYSFYQKNGFSPSGTKVLEYGVRYEIFTQEGHSVSKTEFLSVMEHLIGRELVEKYYKDA